jgi:anti-sigma regulatory factor (Ser/Thr protein kinase)
MTIKNFPSALSSAGKVRAFVRETLAGAPAEFVEDVAIMASELAANAVRHAESDFSVRIERSAHEVRVEVSDFGRGWPVVQSPDKTNPSGRGLLIVRTMSSAWGVLGDRDATAKTVWFTVELSGRSSRTGGDETTSAHARPQRSTGNAPSQASPSAPAAPQSRRSSPAEYAPLAPVHAA